jgi:hypothetical protein
MIKLVILNVFVFLVLLWEVLVIVCTEFVIDLGI